MSAQPPTINFTLERAKLLGEYPCGTAQSISRKAIQLDSVSEDSIVAALPDPVSWWHHCENLLINEGNPAIELSNWITEALYSACKRTQRGNRPSADDLPKIANAYSRWQALLAKKDPKLVWASINWKGEFEAESGRNNEPSNEDFRRHFQKLLCSSIGCAELKVPVTDMYVPLLDDPITTMEVDAVIKKLHRHKAAGVDGVPPGVFKMLSNEWLCILTYLFNLVFS